MTQRRRWLLLAAGGATVLVLALVALANRGSSKPRVSLAGETATTTPTTAPTPAPAPAPSDPNTSSSPAPATTGVTSAPTRPAASSTTTTAAPASLTITEADNGKSFVVHRGQPIDVELSASSIYTWSEPASSNDMAVHRSSGSGGDTASATFVAMSNGTADITAQHTPKCYPQCKAPTFLFQVHITVVT